MEIVLPMNLERTGWVNGVLISVGTPRPNPFNASSPATIAPKRTQRQQRMQRSRSSTSTDPSETGLAKSRFSSTNRLRPGPEGKGWSCSGHSPPLSQMGQSSGWLIRRNSKFLSWAPRTSGVDAETTMRSSRATVTARPSMVSVTVALFDLVDESKTGEVDGVDTKDFGKVVDRPAALGA